MYKRQYHLESRWRNSHVLLYHDPLRNHILGVAPSTYMQSLKGTVAFPGISVDDLEYAINKLMITSIVTVSQLPKTGF